jgi:hypothetical protein
MQASQAITASSSLGNSSWQAREGHGLFFRPPNVGANERLSLDQVEIGEAGADMAAQKLAAALDSPLLASSTSLLSLIASLENQRLVRSSSATILRPLTVVVQSGADLGQTPRRASSSWVASIPRG